MKVDDLLKLQRNVLIVQLRFVDLESNSIKLEEQSGT